MNGLYVVDADMERVQAEIADAGNILDLVLARSHELVVDRMEVCLFRVFGVGSGEWGYELNVYPPWSRSLLRMEVT